MTARSPLADRAEDLARLGGVEVAFLTQIDVRVGPEPGGRFGFPLEPNTVARADGREDLWLGPDEWLVVAGPGRADELAADLERAMAGEHHSVVDVSANRAVLELAGPNRLDVLATACPLDLHPRAWNDGRCAQSVLGAAQVLLQERGDATRVFVRPSFAGYAIDLLLAALP